MKGSSFSAPAASFVRDGPRFASCDRWHGGGSVLSSHHNISMTATRREARES